MNKQISPPAAIGGIAVVVLVIVFAIWRSMAGPPAGDRSKIPAGLPGSIQKVTSRPANQLPVGVSPPIGAPSNVVGNTRGVTLTR